jgi:galactokinase
LAELFVQLYGPGPIHALRAPARINILGEHIDYVSYLPTASLTFGSREHAMVMLFRHAETGRIRGASTLSEYPAFEFTPDEGPGKTVGGPPQDSWTGFLYSRLTPAPHWGNYVKGSVYFARHKYARQIEHGFDFLVDSSIPAGGGASSSSALVVLSGAAVRAVNGIDCGAEELARDSSQAEWYMGTRGGAMDHLTICLSKARHAVHIRYPGQGVDLVDAPSGPFRWVTFFSHAADKGSEVMLQYNERAAVSRILIPAIIEKWKYSDPSRARAWQDALFLLPTDFAAAVATLERLVNELPLAMTVVELSESYPDALAQCRRAFPALLRDSFRGSLKIRARAFHHLGEISRVAEAVRLFHKMSEIGATDPSNEIDEAMQSVGVLLGQSHLSLRDFYEVCTDEVDRLMDIIESDSSVYGARLMGGGFGGNVLVLTAAENVKPVTERVQAEYYGPRLRDAAKEGSIMVSTPGDGLAVLEVGEPESG